MNFSSQNIHQFVQSWYNVPQSTDECMELYEKTRQVIEFLETSKEKELCEALIKGFGKESGELGKWIASNTRVEIFKEQTSSITSVVVYAIKDIISYMWGTPKAHIDVHYSKNFSGAYQHIHHLFETISKIYGQSNPEELAKVKNDALLNISKLDKEANPLKLPKEFFNQYFSSVDLLSLRKTSVENLEIADSMLIEMIDQINSGKKTLSDIQLESVREIVNFFGDKTSRITRLSLNKPSDNDILIMSKAFPNLKHLTVIEGEMTNVSHPYFTSMIALKSLDLNCRSEYSQKFNNLSFLKDLKNLTCLTLSGFDYSQNFGVLKDCFQLTALTLSMPRGGDVTFLKHLPNLTTLNLSGSEIGNLNFLEMCRNVISLNINHCMIRDYSPLNGLHTLKSLEIEDCTFQLDLNTLLENCPNLTYLNLKDNDIEDFSGLQLSPKITHLKLNLGSGEENIVPVMDYCRKLKIIDLSDSPMDALKDQIQAFLDKGIEVITSGKNRIF